MVEAAEGAVAMAEEAVVEAGDEVVDGVAVAVEEVVVVVLEEEEAVMEAEEVVRKIILHLVMLRVVSDLPNKIRKDCIIILASPVIHYYYF